MPKSRVGLVLIIVSLFLLSHTSKCEGTEAKLALENFLGKVSNNNGSSGAFSGWNSTSDPCKDQWWGLKCDRHNLSVTGILLEGLNFSGIFYPSILCSIQSLKASLTVISLSDNSLSGENLDALANCNQLMRLNLNGNNLCGTLPQSLSVLNNLKKLDVSNNKFTGYLPDLPRISGLTQLFAQNNQLSGALPNFQFHNLVAFNVSNKNFSGPIPNGGGRFDVSSFFNNPQLCGDPLPKCPSLSSNTESDSDQQSKQEKKSKGISKNQILMFLGYFLIGLALCSLLVLRLCTRSKISKTKEEKFEKVAAVDVDPEDSIKLSTFTSKDCYKTDGASRSQISAATPENESTLVSSSLIVLPTPEVNKLKFEDLLKAPAELLGRGSHGSVYKITCEDQGMTLAVKRIRGWSLPNNDFKQRMRRLDQVRHPNLLSAVAFYCSRQEKLLVYEFQPNGNLFRLLHGTQVEKPLDWSSRLAIAATISEALAFMHQELREDGIAHENLKSSNILLNMNMEPRISEYGMMVVDNEDHSIVAGVNSFQAIKHSDDNGFKADIYGFGVILLELLTGKMVQNNGMDLATWVLSVVREEWTVEVFDRAVIREGASEERMVNLLQVAIKCVNRSPVARPNINQVSLMINTIREEEERSMVDLSTPYAALRFLRSRFNCVKKGKT